ncbi:T9SS type A sorting domain-containing protein [Candidatus Cloacimonadota bacterium]
MKQKILFFLFIVMSHLICQNPPDTLWTKTFGGDHNDAATCVRQTSDGGFFVIGSTDPLGNDMNDFWLIKTDEMGNLIWEAAFGGDQDDCPYIGQQTMDGGYVVVGYTESFGNGLRDFWLVKTDAEGNEEWNQTYGTQLHDRAQFLEQTSDGGYILTGGTGYFEGSGQDIWLIKTDAVGTVEWEQTFGGEGIEKAYTVHQETNGSYILTGYTTSFGNGNLDVWLIKTDEFGNEIWSRTFGGTEIDNAYSLQICPDGGYILAGITRSFGQGQDDVWLIKTDSLGIEEWNKVYGTEDTDFCYSVSLTNDGSYILGCSTNSTANSDFDVLAMKIDEFGNELWTVKIGESSDDFSFYIEQTNDEGFVLAGRSNSFGNGDDDIYLIKLEPDEVDSENILDQPSGFKLWNYPNPFNPSTTINFETSSFHEFPQIEIYNLKGQMVKTFSSFQISQSLNQHIVWNGTNQSNNPVSSGIYYYKLNIPNSPINKMLLIK